MQSSKNVTLGAFVGVMLLAPAGCQTAPEGYVAREWSKTMRELQIIPVFPPREDVLVGDVYLSLEKPGTADDERGFVPLHLWIASIDLRAELQAHYSKRTSFPVTAGFGSIDPTDPGSTAAMAQPTGSDSLLSQGGDTNRLRLVGFPEFMSATFSQGDLSALVPLEAVGLGFAASGNSARSVTVRIPVAESYGLPASAVVPRMNVADLLSPAVAEAVIPDVETQPAGTSKVLGYLRVITEVYYTRVIDVTVESERALGGAISVQPSIPLGAAAGMAEGAGSAPAVRPSSPQARAALLNQQLGQQLEDATPGGSVRFVSVGEQAVSMQRTYERPMAIGFRGFWVTVVQEVDEGGRRELFISGAGTINDWHPTAVRWLDARPGAGDDPFPADPMDR